jgi:peptidoglycan/LPS O-acetylase OafA/YrhL
MIAMAAGAATLLLVDFGAHRFTDAGLALARAVRGGLFRVLFAALLLHALFAPTASASGRFFRSRPMTALGKYSYGLYVYHHFLSYYMVTHGTEFVLARVLGSHTLAVAAQAACGIALSLAVAWLSYEAFEKRFLRLKRRWPSSRRASAAPMPGAP